MARLANRFDNMSNAAYIVNRHFQFSPTNREALEQHDEAYAGQKANWEMRLYVRPTTNFLRVP
jgi:hypothetical protein